ncbi:MAG: transcriptional regulator PpsR [Pseudomonadota bacterium]
MKVFDSPIKSFAGLSEEDAALMVAVSTDISMVLDKNGVIQDLSIGNDEIAEDEYQHWLGKAWIDTVTVESRPKIESLLSATDSFENARWRQVNHPSVTGNDLPIQYATIQLGGESDMRIAIGRYLGSMATLQQQLVDAQQSMERHYWQFRHLETRYRLLFKISEEGIFVVDAQSQNIIEMNPFASQLLDIAQADIKGESFINILEKNSSRKIEQIMAGVRATGKIEHGTAKLLLNNLEVDITVSLFPQNGNSVYLVRLAPLRSSTGHESSNVRNKLLRLVDSAPDGFVVTRSDGNILTANQAFLELIGVFSEEQIKGEPLSKWLGRPGIDMNVLSANLREQGKIRLFSTTLRSEHDAIVQVEISAKSVLNGDQPNFAFIIRDISLRLDDQNKNVRKIPRPVQQMTELVGRVPLKELVQESTNMIEKYCIEAALEITGDNRASAAEMLGLSRQGLYSKLRRYGLGELGPENENS